MVSSFGDGPRPLHALGLPANDRAMHGAISRLVLLAAIAALVADCKSPASPTGDAARDDVRTLARELCAKAACAGPLASLEIYRDASGALGAVYFVGDLGSCSHPPGILFGPAGEERMTIPERPVTADEAAAIEAEREGKTQGLVAAEKITCKSVAEP